MLQEVDFLITKTFFIVMLPEIEPYRAAIKFRVANGDSLGSELKGVCF